MQNICIQIYRASPKTVLLFATARSNNIDAEINVALSRNDRVVDGSRDDVVWRRERHPRIYPRLSSQFRITPVMPARYISVMEIVGELCASSDGDLKFSCVNSYEFSSTLRAGDRRARCIFAISAYTSARQTLPRVYVYAVGRRAKVALAARACG